MRWAIVVPHVIIVNARTFRSAAGPDALFGASRTLTGYTRRSFAGQMAVAARVECGFEIIRTPGSGGPQDDKRASSAIQHHDHGGSLRAVFAWVSEMRSTRLLECPRPGRFMLSIGAVSGLICEQSLIPFAGCRQRDRDLMLTCLTRNCCLFARQVEILAGWQQLDISISSEVRQDFGLTGMYKPDKRKLVEL